LETDADHCSNPSPNDLLDMRVLPTPLLLLVAAQVGAQSRLPTAIRKMAPDAGEKFYHEYCAFEAPQETLPGSYAEARSPVAARELYPDEDVRLLAANASAQLPVRPPFAPHRDGPSARTRQDGTGFYPWDLVRRAADALSRLEKRQWACPDGTTDCSGIGFPYTCCGNGETCVRVTDTGLGSVGCCPAGLSCGGTISGCPQGAVGCPASMGGACCIPGFVCEGIGCEFFSSSKRPRCASDPA
jgi:hypothetical protein